MIKSQFCALLILLSAHLSQATQLAAMDKPAIFSEFEQSFPKQEGFFPIGVWIQNPSNAGKYKAMGVNFYIGLWAGPTTAQVADLKKHDMMFNCDLNEYTEQHLLDEPLAVGWMHGDEPDLAHHYPRKLLKGLDGKKTIKAHWPEIYEELDLDNNDYNV